MLDDSSWAFVIHFYLFSSFQRQGKDPAWRISSGALYYVCTSLWSRRQSTKSLFFFNCDLLPGFWIEFQRVGIVWLSPLFLERLNEDEDEDENEKEEKEEKDQEQEDEEEEEEEVVALPLLVPPRYVQSVEYFNDVGMADEEDKW